jgi:hypothetical protein
VSFITEKLIDLFLRGFTLGILTIPVILVLKWSSHRYKFLQAIAPGNFIALAFIFGELAIRPVPIQVWFGFVILCISSFPQQSAIRGLLILTGAILFSSWSISELWLRAYFVFLTLWLSFSFRFAGSYFYFLLFLSAGAIFTMVPDTEDIMLFIGVLLPVTLMIMPIVRRFAFSQEHASLAAAIAWVICVGGQGRPASVVTSFGCLALLAALPLLRALKLKLLWSGGAGMKGILPHLAGIAIVLVIARTTSQIDRALLASGVAIAVSGITYLMLQNSLKDKGRV